MPGLTVKPGERSSPSSRISQPNSSSAAPGQRTSTSPPRPPVEPLSPVLGPASLATSKQTNAPGGPAKKTFTHSQAATQYVAPPPPKPVSLEENPDAIALRAAMSILQIQKRRAEGDLIALQKIQNRAREDPEGFRDALLANQIPKKTDGLFNLSKEDIGEDSDEDNEDEEDEDRDEEDNDEAGDGHQTVDDGHEVYSRNATAVEEDEDMVDAPDADNSSGRHREDNDVEDDDMIDVDHAAPSPPKIRRKKSEKWPPLPARQNVVRMPAINWSQYAVVGESLDKLHEDQRKNPVDGAPQILGPDGRVKAAEGGKQRGQPAVIAAPYDAFKDKIEKKKPGKR